MDLISESVVGFVRHINALLNAMWNVSSMRRCFGALPEFPNRECAGAKQNRPFWGGSVLLLFLHVICNAIVEAFIGTASV